MSIITLKGAQALWKRFYERFNPENIAVELKPEQKKYYEQRLSAKQNQELSNELRKKKPEHHPRLKELLNIQKKWRERLSHDSHLRVNPNGNHSRAFHHLLNQQKDIKKSLNQKKLDALHNALEAGNWKDPIFKDLELPYLSLSLYASGKITQQQAYTLLELTQDPEPLKIRENWLANLHPILDEDGQFTKEARDYLLPCLCDKRQPNAIKFPQFTNLELEEFRLLIQALPKSEQYFYLKKQRNLSPSNLQQQLLLRASVYSHQDSFGNIPLRLSSGVRDSLMLVRFGLDSLVRPMPQLGKLSKDDIEAGVRLHIRPAALAHPQGKTSTIHSYQNVLPSEATDHDFYHAQIMSNLGPIVRAGLLRLVDITRQETIQNSTERWGIETWSWIDGEYLVLFSAPRGTKYKYNNNRYGTEVFCKELCHQASSYFTSERSGVFSQSSFFRPKPIPNLTSLGALAILDMLVKPEEWKKIGIETAYLTGGFKTYFQLANAICDELTTRPTKIQILKLQIYIAMIKQGEETKFKDISTFIDKHQETVLSKLTFVKNKKSSRTLYKNSFHLYWGDTPIEPDPEKNKHLIVQIVRDCEPEITCPPSKAQEYIEARERNMGKVIFDLNPTFTNWIYMHPALTTLAALTLVGLLILIPFAYAETEAKQAEKDHSPSPTF